MVKHRLMILHLLYHLPFFDQRCFVTTKSYSAFQSLLAQFFLDLILSLSVVDSLDIFTYGWYSKSPILMEFEVIFLYNL